MLFGKGEYYKLGIYLVLEHIWACSALKSAKNEPKIIEITFQPKKIIRNCTFFSIFGSMVWEILGTRTNPFSVPKVGKKSNNVKYINNVIVHTIWIIQFHDQFLFYSDVVIDYWLWTVKAWKISPITWQSPCWNVPALVWSQKLFPGWEQSFDMIWFWKISCLFTILFFSWNWFHGKRI